MVKFGARLAEERVPEWEKHYVNYKQMKKQMKQSLNLDVEGKPEYSIAEVLTGFDSIHSLGFAGSIFMPQEHRLKKIFEAQLNDVNDFAILQYSKLRDYLEVEIVKVLAECKNAEQVKKSASDLSSAGETVANLDSFVRLNFIAFRKIAKKFHRKGAGTDGWYENFLRMVVGSAFMDLDFNLLVGFLNERWQQVRQLRLKHDPKTFRERGPELLGSSASQQGGGGAGTRGGCFMKYLVRPHESFRLKVAILEFVPMRTPIPNRGREEEEKGGEESLPQPKSPRKRDSLLQSVGIAPERLDRLTRGSSLQNHNSNDGSPSPLKRDSRGSGNGEREKKAVEMSSNLSTVYFDDASFGCYTRIVGKQQGEAPGSRDEVLRFRFFDETLRDSTIVFLDLVSPAEISTDDLDWPHKDLGMTEHLTPGVVPLRFDSLKTLVEKTLSLDPQALGLKDDVLSPHILKSRSSSPALLERDQQTLSSYLTRIQSKRLKPILRCVAERSCFQTEVSDTPPILQQHPHENTTAPPRAGTAKPPPPDRFRHEESNGVAAFHPLPKSAFGFAGTRVGSEGTGGGAGGGGETGDRKGTVTLLLDDEIRYRNEVAFRATARGANATASVAEILPPFISTGENDSLYSGGCGFAAAVLEVTGSCPINPSFLKVLEGITRRDGEPLLERAGTFAPYVNGLLFSSAQRILQKVFLFRNISLTSINAVTTTVSGKKPPWAESPFFALAEGEWDSLPATDKEGDEQEGGEAGGEVPHCVSMTLNEAPGVVNQLDGIDPRMETVYHHGSADAEGDEQEQGTGAAEDAAGGAGADASGGAAGAGQPNLYSLWQWLSGFRAEHAVLQERPRVLQAAVRVEPKTFFANERTYLTWMNTSVLLATVSIGVMNFGSPKAFVGGLLGSVVAIGLIIYSFVIYYFRERALAEKAVIDYNDQVGPMAVTVVLCVMMLGVFAFHFFSE
uniref:SPX domain-containing protein n=1 Tax=Chromera velia CCMP2878 TaxID=1169474 RepID=A0A0G4IBW0_9ALVE|eukprot:Cvel_12917.t1-p1 / transcript=Cvel_12917.t1 / gene=Cvel_12917 / organism=Chromera_velia_CCMP2878 / gene_product=Vacuolar transporter chaperone 1, putative / transcript_product=Vacuolar transporter chaperone 1, putative / location=Cvel_scaffold863:33556-40270(-) / protein_length=956 / sequence_SO=supercontig / SO=protein_coding / is_pseudo=false